MSKRLWAAALSVALVVGGACKKEEAAPAKKPGGEKKDEKKTPPPPPKPTPLAGAELAKLYADCWDQFSTSSWDRNVVETPGPPRVTT